LSGPSLSRGGQKQQGFEQQFGTGSFGASQPLLTRPTTGFQLDLLQNPQNILSQFLPQSALQQQVGQTFQQLVGGSQPFNQTNSALMEQLGLTGVPGGNVVAAAQPIFQRNLQQGADILRQSGPRFASATGQQIGQQGQRAMQDFNLFQQQAIESGLNRQLQATQAAGQFGLGQQGMNMSFLLPLLQQAISAGQGPAMIQQNPGFFQNLMQLGGTAASFIPFAGGGPQAQTGGSFQAAPNYLEQFNQNAAWNPQFRGRL
jgi:hypothetical protein